MVKMKSQNVYYDATVIPERMEKSNQKYLMKIFGKSVQSEKSKEKELI